MTRCLTTQAMTWAGLRLALSAAVDLVLPSSCAACATVAAGPLCPACVADVRAASRGVGPAGPRPPPAPMPPCWAGARFEGAVRLAVTAYKDDGRRDLRDHLARLLSTALCTALDEPDVRRRLTRGEEVLVVPVPTGRASRRRRGDDPVGALARAAVGLRQGTAGGRHAGAVVVAPALVHTRRVADQSRLDRRGRARNLAGSMAVAAGWSGVVQGATIVVVDDVVTTGATLAEAARALRAGGAGRVVAATCATTPRRAPDPPLWPSGRQTSVVA